MIIGLICISACLTTLFLLVPYPGILGALFSLDHPPNPRVIKFDLLLHDRHCSLGLGIRHLWDSSGKKVRVWEALLAVRLQNPGLGTPPGHFSVGSELRNETLQVLDS